MTTPITAHRAQARVAPAPGRTISLTRAYRAELTKLVTVRSTGWLAVAITLSIAVVGVANAVGRAVQVTRGGPDAPADPSGGALTGVGTAVVVAAALGVLAVTSDYTTGMIRSTFAAVPRRSCVLLGKTAAIVTIVLPVAVGSVLLTVVAVRLILAQASLHISLLHPELARAVLGTGLYLSAVAVVAAGLGWLLRNTAGALVSWFALWTLPGLFVMLLPGGLGSRVAPYLPGGAGASITEVGPTSELAVWGDWAVLAAWAVLASVGALLVLNRRDA